MCYDVASGTRLALKYAKHRGDDPEIINKLQLELELWVKTNRSHYHVSGFAHPHLLVFTNQKPYTPQAFQWGLIPPWVKDNESAKSLSNQTLNAKSETMFEKPSFRESAKSKRCLIYLDAFYEHHHFKGKTYPFHISMNDGTPLSIAGLWEEWIDVETGEIIPTCSIITTTANDTMSKVHNNPKLTEPRMPVILPKNLQDAWLSSIDKEKIIELIQPFPDELLSYHTVHKLKGKEAIGDVPEAELEYKYTELEPFM